MPENNLFPHLPLPFFREGRPKSPPGFGKEHEQTGANKRNRVGHSQRIRGQFDAASGSWSQRREARSPESPEIPPGVPMLLKVEPDGDIDWLVSTFKFEIVRQDQDGYVIVSSIPTNLDEISEIIEDFAEEKYGSGNVARIHEILEDTDRISRILSDDLAGIWPTLIDDHIYTVDISIECIGTITIQEPPKREIGETQENFIKRLEGYIKRYPSRDFDKYCKEHPRRILESKEAFERRLSAWEIKRDAAEQAWETLKDERECEFMNFVADYHGEILKLYEAEERTMLRFPDSLGARIRISGQGLRDLVNNFPYLFEVSLPDKFEPIRPLEEKMKGEQPRPILTRPADEAPCICIIDSGIQEEHILLEPAIDKETSFCFIQGHSEDVADYVSPGGHGTRVAGAVLYKEEIPDDGEFNLSFWLQNAKVLDGDCSVPETLYPPKYIIDVVERFYNSTKRTRLYNHSINALYPCRLKHMSTWAAAIDMISYEKDVLFFQSTGNLPDNSKKPGMPGIIQHYLAGRSYPDYLIMPSCRISNPAQSLQALTVGSVGYGGREEGDKIPFGGADEPSSYSKTGLGIWGTIKPDIVEYGGDFVHDECNPPQLSCDCALACPDLVRSTMHPPSPSHDRDDIGTSFATPKAAHIAARIQASLPDEPALLYRALIAQSARWPDWANTCDPLETLRQIGFGIPDLERATSNSPYRITLVTHGFCEIGARTAHIYQVPIPHELRRPGESHRMRIDVTLSYAAKPRRTRIDLRGYLSTWLTWKVSRKEESLESFEGRVLAEEDEIELDGGDVIPWHLRERNDRGAISGVQRGKSTLQKDWAFLPSYQLPPSFSIAVIGHKGWSKNPADSAKYALAITFEATEQTIEIYNIIKIAVESLTTPIQVPIEVRG